MATYRITYTDPGLDVAEVDVDLIERSGSDYVLYRGRAVVGYIPAINVRSVIRQDDETVDA